jgi:hypothetical protein
MQFQPDHQHLPIPVGRSSPAHRPLRRTAWLWRQRAAILSIAAALTAGAAVAITLLPQDSAMYLDSHGVHVDAALLRPAHGPAPGAWFSGPATLLVRNTSGGVVEAYAAATMGGRAVTGACTGRSGAERCAFTIDGAALSASDTYSTATRQWSRVYSNGRRVTIDVAPGATPVPVALPLDSGWT